MLASRQHDDPDACIIAYSEHMHVTTVRECMQGVDTMQLLMWSHLQAHAGILHGDKGGGVELPLPL